MAFKTEFPFTLPKGYIDSEGKLHRNGVMRLATAKDEIVPLQDYRVQSNRAYLVIVLLSRVISKLGELAVVDPDLRVRGLECLRVCDSSIMPRVPSSNTNAPTIMVGEKASDLVLGNRVAPTLEHAA